MIASRPARIVVLSLSAYLLLWGVTAAFGVPQVKNAVLDSLKPGAGPSTGEPRALASSPAPLLVRVHYGDRALDALEWHVWILGAHGRVRTVWFHAL
jgi:hypothetical protein